MSEEKKMDVNRQALEKAFDAISAIARFHDAYLVAMAIGGLTDHGTSGQRISDTIGHVEAMTDMIFQLQHVE